MTVGRIVRGALSLALLFAAANAWAAGSSLWESQTKGDFDAGELDGVSVTPDGEIVLGPRTVKTTLDAVFAWTLAEDSKGNIYVGTGSDGKIFRVSSKGEAELFAETDLQQVFALAPGDENVLYAAGFPGGKILAVDKEGHASEYFDTGADSVWSLCMTGDGTLVAGTGDEGQIYSIKARGEGSLLYDSPERRILSLLCDGAETIYAGTEQSGIIYRIDSTGRPFVFYDTELEEVTAMTMDNEGALYAVSSPGDLFAKIPLKSPPLAAQGDGGAVAAAMPKAAPAGGGMPVVSNGKKRDCLVYKISREGVATKLWKSPGKLIFSLVFDGTNLLAGSGDEGVIYLITQSGEDSKHYKVDQKQILDMLVSADGRIIASCGNEAAAVILEEGYTDEGLFISQTHDATAVSKWGRIFWEADAPARTTLAISTRSGNSAKPDDTWSEWSRERDRAEGFVSDSPVARFVQWRARLKTSEARRTPVLRKVTVAYLQKNLAPSIASISVGDKNGNQKKKAAGAAKKSKAVPPGSGMASKAGPEASKDGVKTAPASHSAQINIKWKTSDENGDELESSIYFRGVDEKRWKLLEDELSKNKYEWDTEAAPDGEYQVKVIVSDSPDNPEENALEAERRSEVFTVDNTSPTVSSLRVSHSRGTGEYKVTCAVSDNLSPVRSAQYSVDAGDWINVFPADGIFDSISERMEFAIQPIEGGEHTVVLKVVDYFGNVGAGKTTFEVK